MRTCALKGRWRANNLSSKLDGSQGANKWSNYTLHSIKKQTEDKKYLRPVMKSVRVATETAFLLHLLHKNSMWSNNKVHKLTAQIVVPLSAARHGNNVMIIFFFICGNTMSEFVPGVFERHLPDQYKYA